MTTKAKTDVDRLRKRWGALKTERTSWMSHWKDCSQYILPRTGRFFSTDRNQGGDRTNLIYDNTATIAARTLAAGMLGGLTSPARPWFRLTTGDAELDEHQAVKLWLADVTRRMQRVFAQSNTYRALHSIYEELGIYGTASATVLDDFENLIHIYTHTAGEYALAADYRGKVNTLYRAFQKTVGQIVAEFGLENCSRSVRNMHAEGNLDSWVEIVHAIEPRVDRDPRKFDARNMAWRSVYFEAGGNEDKLLRDSGFRRFRVLAPRWVTTAQDIYGSSPGMEVLGDVKQLQHEQLRKSQAIDYQSNPPLAIPTALKNVGVDRMPGGENYIDMATQTGGVKSLFEAPLRIDYLLDDIRDVRERIRAGFYADLFLMLANADRTNMTATEVAERHEEKLLMLGPVLERLHNELLDPLIELVFARMLEAGEVPQPPEQLDGVELSVEFVSLLAQAQRAVGTNSIDRFALGIAGVAQLKPEVLDKFDADQWADVYADALGVDPSLIVGDDQVAAIREARAQAQQQAAAQETAMQAVEAAAKLGTVKTNEPNAMNDILGNLTGYTSPGAQNY